MLNKLPLIMLRCLLLTITIEGLAALICGVRAKRDLLMTCLANLMTNPVLVCATFLLGFFYGASIRMPVEIALELAVVIVEGFVYKDTLKYKKINPFLLSFILNAVSYSAGYLINPLILSLFGY